ncbi:small ribosomal subunit protein bS16m [Monosporozyma unispora]|nr:37S ribosomal protein S16, mitochondrial [Kazachstania unispora]
MTKGLVRIRLARFGRKNNPVYNIVVTQSFRARDAKPIEVLGTYNPRPFGLNLTKKKNNELPWKDVKLDFNRAQYWIGCGAQPSDTMIRIFKKAGILTNAWGNKSTATTNNNINNREIISPRREVFE